MEQLKYKNYTGTVEWSEEDNCYFGHILGIKGTSLYEGESISELRSDFQSAVDAHLDPNGWSTVDLDYMENKLPFYNTNQTIPQIIGIAAKTH